MTCEDSGVDGARRALVREMSLLQRKRDHLGRVCWGAVSENATFTKGIWPLRTEMSKRHYMLEGVRGGPLASELEGSWIPCEEDEY